MEDQGGSVILDSEVLTAAYLPNRMIHRDHERQQIARNLKPILRDKPAINMLLYGPPGTGKTAMARYVVNELEQHEPDLLTATIDCFQHPTRFDFYYKFLRSNGKFLTREGHSTEQLAEMFEEKVRDNPTIIIVDEADQLKNEELLYDLARFQNLCIIMTANTRKVFDSMDDRIKSRYSARNNINFRSYREDQLTGILQDRKKYGLRPGSIDNELIKLIAEKSRGDARVAIGTLRIAAQDTENHDEEKIDEETVLNSFPEAVEENDSPSLRKLNRHQRALYNVLKKKGELEPSKLYEQYQEDVEDPKSKRTLQRYLKKMEEFNLIESQGEKRWKKYRTT